MIANFERLGESATSDFGEIADIQTPAGAGLSTRPARCVLNYFDGSASSVALTSSTSGGAGGCVPK